MILAKIREVHILCSSSPHPQQVYATICVAHTALVRYKPVWVKKLLNVTFKEFLRCPIFDLRSRFHENPDILEVVHYNVKLLYKPPHISIPVHFPSPWLSIDMSYPY